MDWHALYELFVWATHGWLNVAAGFYLGYSYLKDKQLQTIYFAPVIAIKRGSGKMPVAVVTITTKRYELKTLPDGFVVVRRMNYGESLLRAQQSTKFLMGGTGKNDFQGELDIQTAETALWDFAHLIVEHNLTDENEVPLNFKNKIHVQRLDSAIGDEIGHYIDEWNDIDTETNEEVKNLSQS